MLSAFAPGLRSPSLRPDLYSIKGPKLGRSFTVQLLGEGGLAVRRVKKALEMLKDQEGKWREFPIKTPSGDAADLFVGRDRNKKQRATEISTKALAQHLQSVKPTIDFYAKKSEGIVTSAFEPVAQLLPRVDGHTDIEWNKAWLQLPANQGFDKEAALAAVASGMAPKGRYKDIEWCS